MHHGVPFVFILLELVILLLMPCALPQYAVMSKLSKSEWNMFTNLLCTATSLNPKPDYLTAACHLIHCFFLPSPKHGFFITVAYHWMLWWLKNLMVPYHLLFPESIDTEGFQSSRMGISGWHGVIINVTNYQTDHQKLGQALFCLQQMHARYWQDLDEDIVRSAESSLLAKSKSI